MESKRYVVFSDAPDRVVTTAAELGAFASYLRKEFPDLNEAKTYADANEAGLGTLKILDREKDEVVYVSRAGRHAGSLTGSGKPPWP